MFSISKISDAGAAHHYFSEKDDYYLRDLDAGSAAQWYGAGAERAGLSGEVDPDSFKAALEGRVEGRQVGDPGRHTGAQGPGHHQRHDDAPCEAAAQRRLAAAGWGHPLSSIT